MDCHGPKLRRRKSFGGGWRIRRPPSCGILLTLFAYGLAGVFLFIPPATCQQHSLVNTPPILYVPERNWRIPETEEVGQIISRIRAEDPENDELVFGLEPHFLSNFGDSSANDLEHKLPFRIDPARGVVYLNESLIGRGGENFFLYITVSDGVLTAKNEVFVNILSKDNKKSSSYRAPPSLTSVVQNISQILPPFDTLPGVQSIRNQQPNQRPASHLPPNFGYNPNIVRPNRPNVVNKGNGNIPAIFNFHPSQSLWDIDNANSGSAEYDNDITTEERNQLSAETTSPTTTTGRIKLTPVGSSNGVFNRNASTSHNKQNSSADNRNQDIVAEDADKKYNSQDAVSVNSTLDNLTTAYPINPTMILVIFAICGLFVAASVIFGFLYRKRLCAISKKLKKKSKEDMVKKSNQSNLSSNLTDDSRNSMVMQHWNGPIAYGNRYVPWERDQQQLSQPGLATSQLSTSVMNGNMVCGDLGGSPYAANGSEIVLSGNGAITGAGNGENRDSGNGSLGKYDRWEFPRHRLKFFNILGEGAFGQVWRCEAIDIDGIEGVSTVAVKTLKENTTEAEKKDLMSELDVMKSLEPHINVVRLLGCCTDKDPMFVVIEYVNRGKLQTYLRNSRAERHYGNTHGKSNVLTSGDLTSFMYQVAKGMDYLTSRGIIHRDLAARNILITDDHTCKVADFGFARDVVTSKIYERKSEGKLPIRWMAIESLYDNIFSVKSDIWSFGILMWEIVTLGSTPYPGISAADVMRKVRDGFRLEKPDHCRRELYNIMYYCWANDANERPAFGELVQMLDKLLHTEMDYIELERFPDHNYYNILNLSGEKL